MSSQHWLLNSEPKDVSDPREQRTVMKHHRPGAPNQAASDLRCRAGQCRTMAMAALDSEYFREMWEYADVLDQKADEIDDGSLSL
jgi:hypothetical protein